MPGAAERTTTRMSLEGFLAFVDARPERAGERWELHDGAPVLMVGGTAAHALIAGNIDRALHDRARERGCRVMRGFLAAADDHSVFEPDVMVRCGPIDPRSRSAADPIIVFEVLSPSTLRYDRGIKLERYRAIASLRQIVLVYQDSPRVESWLRGADEVWNEEALVLLALSDRLPLPALDAEIPLSAAYDGLGEAFGRPSRLG